MSLNTSTMQSDKDNQREISTPSNCLPFLFEPRDGITNA